MLNDKETEKRYRQRAIAIRELHRTGTLIPLMQYHIDYPTSYFGVGLKRRILKELKHGSK